jgi:hypothetical protein
MAEASWSAEQDSPVAASLLALRLSCRCAWKSRLVRRLTELRVCNRLNGYELIADVIRSVRFQDSVEAEEAA